MPRLSGGRPRVIIIGKGGFPYPVDQSAMRKLEILERHFQPTIISTGQAGVRRRGRSQLVSFPDLSPRILGGALFYGLAPVIGITSAVRSRASGVICQSPYEAFGIVVLSRLLPKRIRPKILVEVHGDWRTAPRLYGSRARRIIAPLSDQMAAAALRRADLVRVVSKGMKRLVRSAGYTGPVTRFLAYSDYSSFLESEPAQLPDEPRVLFLGVLQRYKGVDILIEAWPHVLRAIPTARLVIAGKGPLRASLQRRVKRSSLGASVRFLGHLPREQVRTLLDRSSLLVLPSRSEGLGRVVLEAFARGRPVVASDVGGIGEIVQTDHTGFLVPPGDPVTLANAVIEVLGNFQRLETMGAEGRRQVAERDPAAEFEAGMATVAKWIQDSKRDEQPRITQPRNRELRRIVFVTQTVDASDPLLGFVVGWIRALASRADDLVVIANRVGSVPHDLPAQVLSLGKEKGAGRLLRGVRYQRCLMQTMSRFRTDALVAHMCPIYLTLAAPVCKLFRVPLVLWFAHPRDSVSLAIADRLADRVLTSLPLAYPRPSRKLNVIGQGIDIKGFPLLPPTGSENGLRLLAIGRTSPTKGFRTIVLAARELLSRRIPVFVRIVGPSTTELELRERRGLLRLIAELGVESQVKLEEAVRHNIVPNLLAESDVLVNATVPGSGDKVVLEAMASGRVVVASNPAFDTLLGNLPIPLQFSPGDPIDLSSKLEGIARHDSTVRTEIGRILRQRVEAEHSTEDWARRLVGVVASLRRG